MIYPSSVGLSLTELVFFTPQPHLRVPRMSFAVRVDAVFLDTGTVMVVQTVMMVLMSPLPVVSTTHNNIQFQIF